VEVKKTKWKQKWAVCYRVLPERNACVLFHRMQKERSKSSFEHFLSYPSPLLLNAALSPFVLPHTPHSWFHTLPFHAFYFHTFLFPLEIILLAFRLVFFLALLRSFIIPLRFFSSCPSMATATVENQPL